MEPRIQYAQTADGVSISDGCTRCHSGMQDKSVREWAAICQLIHHYRAVGRGEWLPEKGPDPPDFIIVNSETEERAGVEHTSFIWPPDEVGWYRATQALMEDVRGAIENEVRGSFVISFDQDSVARYIEDYGALSKRRKARRWLADQLRSRGANMAFGRREMLSGLMRVEVTRYDTPGRVDVRCARRLSSGDDLGFTLSVELPSGRLIRTRRNTTKSALNCYEQMLRRKAARLRAFTEGLRILVIDDYSMSVNMLIQLSKVMGIPPQIDELCISSLLDSVLVDFSLLSRGRGA